MKVICSIIIFLGGLLATALQETPPLLHQDNGGLGGFPDFVGTDFRKDRLNSLLNFINSASALYRDDYKKNLMYIHNSMTAAYGNEKDKFGVIIQGNSTDSYSDSWLYGQSSYSASFAAGINMINPSWSYLAFFQESTDFHPLSFEYIPPSGRGTGISNSTATNISQIIKVNDSGPCKCSQSSMWIKLNVYDQQLWDVICHSAPVTHAYVPVYDSQWMSSKPGSCYYVIFVV